MQMYNKTSHRKVCERTVVYVSDHFNLLTSHYQHQLTDRCFCDWMISC